MASVKNCKSSLALKSTNISEMHDDDAGQICSASQVWKLNWSLLEVSESFTQSLPKKSHSTLRAKRATFTIWVDNSLLKMVDLTSFWKPEACGQTVCPF